MEEFQFHYQDRLGARVEAYNAVKESYLKQKSKVETDLAEDTQALELIETNLRASNSDFVDRVVSLGELRNEIDGFLSTYDESPG